MVRYEAAAQAAVVTCYRALFHQLVDGLSWHIKVLGQTSSFRLHRFTRGILSSDLLIRQGFPDDLIGAFASATVLHFDMDVLI